MRMAPLFVKRKLWWELIFISVLLFLLAGIPSQGKREAVQAAQAAPAIVTLVPALLDPVPPAVLGALGTPLPPPIALQ